MKNIIMILSTNGLFQNGSLILETTLGYSVFISQNSSNRLNFMRYSFC